MTSTPIILEDPREKYEKPRFARQQQSIPGREDAMAPEADHGEHRYRGNGRLEGATALITGGDSGIGRAVAIAYALEGANVAFTYLNEDDDAKETERLIRDLGKKEVISFRMNQANRKECDEVIESTVEKFGNLDILVNNAAFQQTYESIDQIPDEDIGYTFRANIESFIFFCRGALKHLRPGASIINTTSIQAFEPSPQLAPYAATKAAIANFTISFAKEAINHGVRVNAVAPGPVWTPLIPSTMPKDKVEKFGANTLFGRPAQPAELAPLYVFLASSDASYITAEIYGVTGGRKQI